MASAALSLPGILAEALLLPEDDRATMAAELLASLHPRSVPSDEDPGWLEEIERRADRVRRGGSEGLAWEAVLDELQRA